MSIYCGDGTFTDIWKKAFRRIKTNDGGTLLDHYPRDITPDDVEVELTNFGLNTPIIIILDEFDQIKDEVTRKKFTETIKSLSDHAVPATLVLVGIAGNASELISDHQSISRALKQVEMPRLTLAELERIIYTRYSSAGIRASDDAQFLMAFLSRGLPYYAHLCGRYSALAAVKRKNYSSTLAMFLMVLKMRFQTLTKQSQRSIQPLP